MALGSQGSPQDVGTAASFHADQAGIQLGDVGDELHPRKPPPKNYVATLVHPDQMETRFAKVDANCVNLHGNPPSMPKMVARPESILLLEEASGGSSH